MPRIISLTSSQVPIAVVSGAYHTFCSGQPEGGEGNLIRTDEPRTEQTVRSLDYLSESFVVDDQTLFEYFVHEWRKERGITSSTTDMILCPSYQAIIGMGPKAIPWILAEMEAEGDDPDHWFWALHILTRANPVAEEDQGNLPRMAQTWMRWAREEGYAW